MNGPKNKNLFRTKTFQGAVLTLAIGLAPVVIECGYSHRWPDQKNAIAIAGLLGTFCWTIVGRVQPPAYTPNGLPGPNESDLKEEHST